MEHMPAARYLVRAYIDRNKNQGIDPSEPWDSASISLIDSAHTDLLLFTHDTVPPHIRDVRANDSVTLQVTFDRPVDPGQTLTAANFAVIGPDSSPLPISKVAPPPRDTAARAAAPVAAPSPTARPPARARTDTTVVVKAAMPRPAPLTDIVINLRRQLIPKTGYRVRAIRIRGLLGHTGDSERVYTVPAPAAPPKPPPTPRPAQ